MSPTERRRVLAHLSQRINAKDNAALFDDVTRYCKRRQIPATDKEMRGMADEAFQLRVARRLKKLGDRIKSHHH